MHCIDNNEKVRLTWSSLYSLQNKTKIKIYTRLSKIAATFF